MTAPSPLAIADPLLSFAVIINGKPINDAYQVLSLNIAHSVNSISEAAIVFADGDPSSGTFPLTDSSDFIPGNIIEIKAGYGGEPGVSIFTGYIVKNALEINANSGPSLTVTCKHKAVQMTFNRKDTVFTNTLDSDIIKKIVNGYGLSCIVTDTTFKHEAVFQKQATDWDFILSRADLLGYIVTFNGDAVNVGAPKTDANAVLRVAYSESILAFSAELSAEAQATSITASGWDIKNQALLTANATEPRINKQGNISAKNLSGALNQTSRGLLSGTPTAKDELKTWADGNLLKMRMSALKGEVSFIGNGSVWPGSIIELDGVGARFNGNAFVASVSHEIKDGNWTTIVKFGLENTITANKPDSAYPEAVGMLPPIHGLQIATVKQLFGDEAGQYRILVNIVSNAGNGSEIWARLSNFYATSGAGAGFVPEVGDEVVVGFLENNPGYPVIIGSLYSTAHKPITEATSNNNDIKSIVTKSQLKISFDDAKKITRIQTPGGNSFMLNDDTKSVEIVDQNGNSIMMTSSGININSAKDITLKATGNITLDATGGVNLKAMQDVAISGLNVSNTAQMAFTAKGNASAELSASGQTTVKGGMVMIN